MPQLTGSKVLELRDILLDAFTPDEFDDLLRQLDLIRTHIAEGANQRVNVLRVIDYFNRRFQVADLIRSARIANPHHPDLVEWQRKTDTPKFTIVERVGQAENSLENNLELERYIRSSNGLKDPRNWRECMSHAESVVCRIEILSPGQEPIFGTGFLVASDIVMTNYHVIEPVHKGAIKPMYVLVRFDFALLSDGVTLNPGTVYNLDLDHWLIEYSPYSEFDNKIIPPQDPSLEQLDFALLRIAGNPGEEPVGGASNPAAMAKSRGYIPLPNSTYHFTPNSALFILQHPAAAALKLALDTDAIIGSNSNHSRVRYRTNTDGGSSGAPCFSDNWELVALHHAGDPNYGHLYNPQFNQGIPIAAIREYLEKHNKYSNLGLS